MNKIQYLEKQGLITPPKFLSNSVHYETIMGSVAYGVSSDTSDMDVYGFCIPPKEDIFPHLRGDIPGFGQKIQRFEQYQQHHIDDKDACRMYDITIYSIVKYIHLCLENNPNMLDSLFTTADCVLSITAIGSMVKDRRKEFLHKGSWHKLKSYAYSQLHKIDIKTPKGLKELSEFEKIHGFKGVTREEVINGSEDMVTQSALDSLSPGELREYRHLWSLAGKRVDDVREHDYDLKFAYNVVRLLDEAEQILLYHDLDLRRNREQLKSIRRGEWSLEDIKVHFASKERQLDEVYANSTLRQNPDEAKIKQLLLDCLEHHYGSLQNAVVVPGEIDKALADIIEIAKRARGRS